MSVSTAMTGKERARKFRENNREKSREHARNWYQRNKEKLAMEKAARQEEYERIIREHKEQKAEIERLQKLVQTLKESSTQNSSAVY
ncbi:hypothetical protein ISTM_390 [Insectomime virus]|uniref:Uncharacterized protein n=1 Tax=Tunisvirus fontaine2 TaxID=1421067 RepID=V9SGV1_9VIRU|nr:hypothetical protein D1R32_gp412 [Tunisvirus fontaine2]AHA46288.1 hypothetical protein ISTM_390 [Insectomime virus]AHC55129.1 hypothetical protein TNS_ORF411 [Tunisvirus fontaine2]